MLHLELKHLRLVAAIADVANMTRAAQTLCLSQPALSKQLAELEAQLAPRPSWPKSGSSKPN
jgi:DNA-binding transcriptional LysR family regulator